MHFSDPPSLIRLKDLTPAMGVLDGIALDRGSLSASGWIFHPDRPINRLQIFVNGHRVHTQTPAPRPDVQRVFPWVNHSDRSGYSLSIESPVTSGRIDVLGEVGGEARVYWSTFFRGDLDDILPTPPEALVARITGSPATAPFKLRGLKIFTDLYDGMVKHGALHSSSCVLDWGCGCGSVAVHLREMSVKEVVGADVDAEAVGWARSNLPGIHFDVTQPHPPLPYDEGRFNAIVVSSVFTHLPAQLQESWLEELSRVVAPGGLVLTSTHGLFSLRHVTFSSRGEPWRFRRKKWRWRLEYGLRGFSDSKLDPTFDGILPRGYYRTVIQSRAHTLKTWEKYFNVVDYIPQGLAGRQDLVVSIRDPLH